MEAQEEVITVATTIKGKRTKRQRVQSPIPFGNLTANSSSGDGYGDGDRDGDVDMDTDGDTNIKNSTNLSPASSQEFQERTQEEEDMANCLILLAQGHNSNNINNINNITVNNHFKYSSSPKQDYYDNDAGVHSPNSTTTKFSSRKFLETGSPGSGKAGYYVYACKTCNRTFPSFQALGGHRASHKKPKLNIEEKKHLTLSSDDEEGHLKDISSLSLQLSSNHNHRGVIYSSSSSSNNNNHHNKNKIHECSICGAEFTSGQALGGHMRRHRAPITAAGSNNNINSNGGGLSLTTRMGIESEQQQVKKTRNLISLDLDLNLPAPDEEKLPFASKQQKQPPQQQKQQQEDQQKPKPPLVFSGPALVDCHY